MKLAVIILSYKRTKNISQVVTSAIESTVKPSEIIVFNNNPKINLEIPKKEVVVINSEKNFGCKVRHAIAQVVDATHFLFFDDDKALMPDTIGNFVKWGKKYPEGILGYWGRILAKGTKPYTEGIKIHNREITIPTEVDVVIGAVHFCSKKKLHIPFMLDVKTNEDDIALCLANKHFYNKNYVIPADEKTGVYHLNERGVGQWHRKEHWDLRNEACLEGLKWKL